MKQDKVHKSFFKRMFQKGESGAWRKFLICVLCIALLISECLIARKIRLSGDGSLARAEESDEVELQGYDSENKTWDVITFGKYKQAGTSVTPESVQWRVLEVSGGTATLLSEKILDYREYNEDDSEVQWDESEICQWLNGSGTDDFLNTEFFNETEQAAMNADPKVSLLEENDLNSNGLDEDKATKAAYTDFVWGKIGSSMADKENGAWMLFTTGSDTEDGKKQVKYVKKYGTDEELVGEQLYSVKTGIRPVVKLDISNTDVWQYVGTVDIDGKITEAAASPSTSADPSASAAASTGPSASAAASTGPSASSAASANPSASASTAPSASSAAASPRPTPMPVATVNPKLIPTPRPAATATPKTTPKPASASPTPEVIKEGVVKKVGKIKYSILSSAYSGGTVSIKRTADKTSKSVVVPDTVVIKGITYQVTEIAKGAFTGMKQLKNLTIGKNVKSIGSSAFESCQKLEFVMIPKNVTAIGSRAFASCKKLHFFVIKSNNLTAVGSKTFLGTNDTIKIKVPKKKLKSYKTLIKNGKVSKNAIFLTSPKTIYYKGNNY